MVMPAASTQPPAGWLPVAVHGTGRPFRVDWCYAGETRLTDPFFADTIARLQHLPFNQLFRPQTRLDELPAMAAARPGLAPTGFIFHMSRCGSTLLSQMLAALPAHVVLSEAGPFDSVLQMHFRDPALTDEERIGLLRAMLSALGQPRTGRESRLFVKLDSWHTLHLPLLRRAFPGVPWVFVYRDPVEVLVSHRRQRGSQMLPGMLPPELFGLQRRDLAGMSLDEYTAHVLAEVCAAALRYRDDGALYLDHAGLPAAGWTAMAAHFGLAPDESELAQMRAVARRDAKSPAFEYRPDGAGKRAEADVSLRLLAGRRLDALYRQLKAVQEREVVGIV